MLSVRSSPIMKRLTQAFFHPSFSTLSKPISPLYNNTIRFPFSKENISSRQVDIKINQERWKNLQNNYKALKTSFGLIVPSTITKGYPTPDRIQFNIQALRQCSNQYPQYLLQELKKQDSRFYQVIDASLDDLWKADKKEAMEFILFILHWRIHLYSEEIGEMLLRTVRKMELNLFEVFQLTKDLLKLEMDKQGVHWEKGESKVGEKKGESKVGEKKGEQKKGEQKKGEQKKGEQKREGKKKNVVEDMSPMFSKMLVICENKIITRLEVIEPQEYEPLFKIVNLFRLYDIYPEVKPSTSKSAKKKQSKQIQAQSQQQQKEQQKQQQQKEQEQLEQEEESTFFQIIQQNLLKNLPSIPPSSLVIMAVHYANNTKENQDQRIQILQHLQERIIFNLKFFSHQELIAILYSYMRTSLLSREFTEKFVQRIRLTYAEMGWENKKKILALCSNFPSHEKVLVISEAHNELIKGKPVTTRLQDGSIKKEYNPSVFIDLDYQLVPEIYLASYENNLLTEDLTKKMQQTILANIYNYDREEVVRSVWLFTVTPGVANNLERLHKKLEVVIEGGFQGGEYTVKDVSIIVWSLCNSGRANQEVYKPGAKFWDNIEFYLQEKLEKQEKGTEPSRVSNVSSILWAYTFNLPLRFKTVSLVTDILLEDMSPSVSSSSLSTPSSSSLSPSQQQPYPPTLQTFELINIITFYYSLPPRSFPQPLTLRIKELCVLHFQSTYQQMNSLQLMKCLKYLTADEYLSQQQMKLMIKLKVWENIIGTFMAESDSIEYEHIMGIVGLVINSPLGRAKDQRVMGLVVKLMERKKMLEQVKVVEELASKARE